MSIKTLKATIVTQHEIKITYQYDEVEKEFIIVAEHLPLQLNTYGFAKNVFARGKTEKEAIENIQKEIKKLGEILKLDVELPECEHDYVYESDNILCSNPPQFKLFCVKCGQWSSKFCHTMTSERPLPAREFYKLADKITEKLKEK